MAGKLMQKATSKFLKELKEFDSLIKAIGECKSKAEEDRIMTQELEVLKLRFTDPRLDKTRGREYMVRLIYCEMLGHDASFGYIKALQFASEPNILTKKAAYLALTQLLDHTNELVLLLVNTLLSDLKSDNFIIVSSALTATTRLIGGDLITAVYPTVAERCRHANPHVRKKAVMALHRFHQLDPSHEGPLAGIDLDKLFRTTLCDKDPSVMSASLCALHDAMQSDPRPYKNLIPSFTSILKQVAEHRLPKSYDYHRFPAPFIQIKLLKILAILGAGDKASSENMYAVVHQTLRRANGSHTIGNALIYECVRTISTLYPNPALLAAATESISGFLKSSSHNLRYVGIDALSGVVKINPAYAQDHQLAVIDCLEDPDDTLKLKTLELLCKMTKANNVEVIVERMMTYLRTAVDEHIKKDIVRKVCGLAERYAPGPAWFMTVMSEVFELGGEHVEAQLAHNLCRLIAEQEEDLHRSAVEIYLGILEKAKQPEILLQVVVWVLGEYGYLAVQSGSLDGPALVGALVSILDKQKPSDALKAAVLTALTKLAAHTAVALTPAAEEFVSKTTSSQSLELQQRSAELRAIMSSSQALKDAVLPQDASREDFEAAELAQISDGATFLDSYVHAALMQGAAPYLPQEARLGGSHDATANGGKNPLRFEAYESVRMPAQPPAVDSISSVAAFTPAATNGHARSSSQGDGAQLTLRGATAAAKASGKWGPAEFAPSEPVKANPSVSKPASAQAVSDLLSLDGSSGFVSAQTPAAVAVPAKPVRPVSERDRLAASIFGGATTSSSATQRTKGGSSQPAVGASASTRGVHAASPPPAPAPDLLGGFSSPVAATSGPTAPKPTVPARDLLMDLDDLVAPSAVPSGASSSAYDMSWATVPQAASSSQPGSAALLDVMSAFPSPPASTMPQQLGIPGVGQFGGAQLMPMLGGAAMAFHGPPRSMTAAPGAAPPFTSNMMPLPVPPNRSMGMPGMASSVPVLGAYTVPMPQLAPGAAMSAGGRVGMAGQPGQPPKQAAKPAAAADPFADLI